MKFTDATTYFLSVCQFYAQLVNRLYKGVDETFGNGRVKLGMKVPGSNIQRGISKYYVNSAPCSHIKQGSNVRKELFKVCCNHDQE
jgi:hypothetical protein